MSDKPLWSDERIAEWVSEYDEVLAIRGERYGVVQTLEATRVLLQMRDEYESSLRAHREATVLLQNKVRKLEQQLAEPPDDPILLVEAASRGNVKAQRNLARETIRGLEEYIAAREAQLVAEKGVAEARRQIAQNLEHLHDALIEKYNALEAQLSDAQAQLDAAIRLGIRQTGEMAALERLRAERWEPVADGKDCTENIHYTIRPDGDHIIVTPTWGGTPHRLYLGKARRLCQRVTGAQPGEG